MWEKAERSSWCFSCRWGPYQVGLAGGCVVPCGQSLISPCLPQAQSSEFVQPSPSTVLLLLHICASVNPVCPPKKMLHAFHKTAVIDWWSQHMIGLLTQLQLCNWIRLCHVHGWNTIIFSLAKVAVSVGRYLSTDGAFRANSTQKNLKLTHSYI